MFGSIFILLGLASATVCGWITGYFICTNPAFDACLIIVFLLWYFLRHRPRERRNRMTRAKNNTIHNELYQRWADEEAWAEQERENYRVQVLGKARREAMARRAREQASPRVRPQAQR